MARVHLTKSLVAKTVCPGERKKIDLFDTEQPGLMLEIRRSGGKTYYHRYTDEHGRGRQHKIGAADLLSLGAARRKSRALAVDVLLGGDPQKRRIELRTIPTLAELVRDRYLPHVKSYKRSWQTDERVLRVHILPALGSEYVDKVRAEGISVIVERMRNKGYASGTTNRVVIVLRHVFNLARKWQVPGVTENPTAGISLAPDVARERFMSAEEAERLIGSIKQDENQVAAQAILLLLLTGARRNEITFAKWDHVDWEGKRLLVPLSKSGRPRSIALNSSALELLRSIDRGDSANSYIFPSAVTGQPSASLHFPWDRIRRRAGLSDLRLHDLRHSYASFLVNAGVSLYVVQNLLGHSHARFTQRYAHLAPNTLNEAAEVVGAVLGSVLAATK